MAGELQPNTSTERARRRTDDAALVAAIAAGERDALAALYDLHAPALLGLARRMLGDGAAAEDLVHDVFLEVWHHAAEYSPMRGSVAAWLTVRTRSRALDRLGRRTRHADAIAELGCGTPDATTAAAPALVDGARVRRLVDALPAELATVLELAYFEGLSSSEIAERLQTPAGTIKSRVARALATLREAMRPGAETAT